MFRLRTRIILHHRNLKNHLVENEIAATIQKSGIVISRAKTAEEVFASQNYNRSVEIPIYSIKKLKTNKTP